MATLSLAGFSTFTYSFAGGSLVFNTPFALGVLSPEHVQAYVVGELDGLGDQIYRACIYNTTSGTTTVVGPLPSPCDVVLQRTVPKDVLFLSFASGADVTRTNIDVAVKYALMALHETLDGRWDNAAFDALNDAVTAAISARDTALAAMYAAQVSQAASEAAYDSFNDRYLGDKSANPVLDNDGNPLLTGALYFNTTLEEMRVYTGAEWVAAYVSLGSVLVKTNNLSDLLAPSQGLANLHGYATTIKSGGTTTLTAASAVYQRFTGVSAQSVVLPDAGTLQLGSFFELHNNDTNGSLTVKSADGSTIMTALPGQIVRLVCVLASGATAASWRFAVCGFPGVTGNGNAVLNNDPIMARPTLFNPQVQVQPALVAGTDAQGQGLITGDLVVVITTAANPSGVTLPAALAGRWITVVNRGTNPINVYPALGAAIDAGAANAPVQIAVGAGATFSASSTTLWLSDMNATQAEAAAGTDNTRTLTPLGLRQGLNASGSAPIYACRAWVNFNGTGVVAIRSSGNVASITDNGTGNYTVNFVTDMPHANYCAQVTSVPKGAGNNVNYGFGLYPGGIKTVSAVQVAVGGASNASGFTVDYDQVNVAIFC